MKQWKRLQVPPQIIYAYKRTGLLLSEELKDTYDPDAMARWEAAIDEYFETIDPNDDEDTGNWMFPLHHAFEGETVGEITIRLAGKDVTRPFRLAWKHTPEWEHFDEEKQELVSFNRDQEAWQVRNQIFADPADSKFEIDPDEPPPEADWEDAELLHCGIRGLAVEDAFEADVLRQCKEIDRDRRRKHQKQ